MPPLAFRILAIALFLLGATIFAEPVPYPFTVRVEGQGPPMILVPGLSCDGRVWNRTAGHLKDRYQCHILSLAGFAGTPPVEGEFLPTMRDGIVRYMREKKLARPVLVGHSLGGHLALAVAIAAPDEVGPVVVVDGAAALGALMAPGAPAEAVRAQAATMRDMLAALNPQAFAAQNRMVFPQLVTDPHTADLLAIEASKGDVRTVARATYELMTADLREAAAGIKSPVLLIGSAPFAKTPADRKAAEARYEAQVAKVPRHKVVMTFSARHFVMQDAPDFFHATLDQFLGEAK